MTEIAQLKSQKSLAGTFGNIRKEIDDIIMSDIKIPISMIDKGEQMPR
jgi:hypothetical protein